MHFDEIIGLWPGLRDLAADLGVPYERVKKWRARGSIHPKHWETILRAAQKRGFSNVTLATLSQAALLSSREHGQRPNENAKAA